MTMTETAPFPLGVSLHTLDPDQTVETMELLCGSSVRAVELFEYTFNQSEGHVRAAREALAAAGVSPRTVHADFDADLDLSSSEDTVRGAGVSTVCAAVDLAARVGAEIVVVHASSEPIGGGERPQRMVQARRSLSTLVSMCRAAGRRLAVELLPRTCLGRSVLELQALLHDLDPAVAGVCLDVNHLMDRYAMLPQVVCSLGPRLFALHISDYDGVDEKHWPPMQGVIDWAAFLSALREVGFAGPLNYEAHLSGRTPAERLAFLENNYAALLKLAP
jgi:sugar phosphate isomerase/epimerase